MVCDMPKSCVFPLLDNHQKRFLWTHSLVDLAPHPFVSLVLQVGDTKKFPPALGFKNLDPFSTVSKKCPCFTAEEENGGDKRLVDIDKYITNDEQAETSNIHYTYKISCILQTY